MTPFRRTHSNERIRALFLDASGTILRGAYYDPMGVELFPDAQALIELCRSRTLNGHPINTGLITNWGRRVHSILEGLELSSCFDIVVCADDVSYGKPAPEPFLLACHSVDVLPAQALHIGDSLYDDAFGAYDAGLQSLWINRSPERCLTPDEERMLKMLPHPACNDLTEALHHLEDLSWDET